MKSSEIRLEIRELENLAQEVLDLKMKSRPRRPIVVEFCGSPKSGKTSAINSLNIFLKRNGFKTKVLSERASVCPIDDKFNPNFNIWTSCSAIAELVTFLSNNPKDIDIIIADRGIFDALCWFNWQHEHSHLDRENFQSLMNFLTMKKWRSIIDFIYVFTATPKVSLDREYAYLLTRRHGSVMNSTTLQEFNDSITEVVEKYGSYFSKVEKIDTSDDDQNKVSFKVTKCTLEILKQIIMEQIGYIDISYLDELKNENTFNLNRLENKSIQIQYGLREAVEISDASIQPIPIAVFTTKKKDKVLMFKKQPNSLFRNSPEANKILLYAGGHIRKEDCIDEGIDTGNGNDFLSIIKSTLSREINEELGISYYPNENESFCIWVKDHPKSKKHLAVCFIFEVDDERFDIRLNKDEFIQKTGKSKSGTFVDINKVYEVGELDSWSEIIVSEIFGIHEPPTSLKDTQRLLDFPSKPNKPEPNR